MDQDNLDQLLSIALRLFAERGYDSVGIREIADASGIPTTSIYYHFKSKLNLYREAAARKYDEVFEAVNMAVRNKRSPRERIDAYVETFFDLFLGDKTLFILVQRDIIDSAISGIESVMISYHMKYQRLAESLLTEEVGRPVSEDEVFAMAGLVLGYCEIVFVTENVIDQQQSTWHDEHKRRICKHVSRFCASLRASEAGYPAD